MMGALCARYGLALPCSSIHSTEQDALGMGEEAPVPASWEWEWEDGAPGSGRWTAYDAASRAALDAALGGGTAAKLALRFGGKDYDLDLQKMTQTKHETGFVRAVRCAPAVAPAPGGGGAAVRLHVLVVFCSEGRGAEMLRELQGCALFRASGVRLTTAPEHLAAPATPPHEPSGSGDVGPALPCDASR